MILGKIHEKFEQNRENLIQISIILTQMEKNQEHTQGDQFLKIWPT